MFNRKSIYALNKKDPNAIVYTDADGNLIRLTRDDFSNEEEFLRWKRYPIWIITEKKKLTTCTMMARSRWRAWLRK